MDTQAILDASHGDLVQRKQSPDNFEYQFSNLSGPITANESFYIRNHFPVPEIDPAGWRLRVEGAGVQPIDLTYEDLRAMPSRSVTAVMECAGNHRSFLEPKEKGLQWGIGAVGNAEWTGVSVSQVLERAGAGAQVLDVVLEGADHGKEEDPKTPGEITYAHSLPLEKALQPDVILAYRMNGEDLPAAHGFPLRAIVPGWYGMASVKWLSRIVLMDRPFHGFFQSIEYTHWEERDGLPTLVPITAMQVKAQIARPAMNEVIPPGSAYRIHGAAWTGEGGTVTGVEVSTDGGWTWSPATLTAQPGEHAWTLWEHPWTVPTEPGEVAILARARDSRGNRQPEVRDHLRRNYMVNHLLPVRVVVG